MDYKQQIMLGFAENTRLETERLILRPLTLADAQDMFEYAQDAETTEHVFPQHQSLAETREIVAGVFMADPLGKYALEEKASGKMIGTIDLRVDPVAMRGEIGYALNKSRWGQGLMPEAAMAILALGFDTLKLVHIQAFHNLANEKSGRVMQKIGMKKEAELPLSRLWKGKPVGEAMYGITSADWFKRVM
ncbi:GNAT family N-acetyltransferase [Candidatus Enterococcus leclercqii]|uniref:GNAT family N-acetyltransferase n=1 Tax=Candidatus Enterococcus leclercqii TaxID=1857218 RepID=UPI001379A513|nr:GNAT family N-acetyltransferase [Enterococcus sp. CU9D]KAF1293447.1 acetyltransferase [Enterococcus sp. CU9D]